MRDRLWSLFRIVDSVCKGDDFLAATTGGHRPPLQQGAGGHASGMNDGNGRRSAASLLPYWQGDLRSKIVRGQETHAQRVLLGDLR